jgi:DNA-binding MarR family transcriptional regulator
MKLEDELQMPAFADDYQKAYLNIIFTANWLDALTKKRLKPFNLTAPQYNVLRILRGRKGVPISAFAIQERMVHRSSNITRILDKLVTKGLAQRNECNQNRRKIDITITDKGLALLNNADHAVEKSYGKIKTVLNPQQAALLSDLMDIIRSGDKPEH